MKTLLMIGMVLLLAACGGQAPKTGSDDSTATAQKKMETAKDVAEQKLKEAEQMKDSLEGVLQTLTQQEAELAAYVMENATTLAEDAPEVKQLNQLRMHLDSLKTQCLTADGQVKFLKKKLKVDD